ncbi:MAG: AAA family ATPase, partial [Thermoanaerobaculia bacterium]
MAITRIKVSNFKSFDELEVDLRPLNVLVGGNASGKSNFLDIFRFLRDMVTLGIENALSLQGGIEFLANFQAPSEPISFDVVIAEGGRYRLSLRVSKESPGYEVMEDVYVTGGRIKCRRVLEGISFFDFDPKLPKKGSPMTGKADLEPDGSNLAVVLKNLLRNRERRENFLLLLRDLLPFVQDLKVESFSDRSPLILLKETFRGPYIPAAFLSDGTLHMAALVLALYFDRSYLTILE